MTSDKWRLCQGEGASSAAGESRCSVCLPWSTNNCTRTRKLESTDREQVAKSDDGTVARRILILQAIVLIHNIYSFNKMILEKSPEV